MVGFVWVRVLHITCCKFFVWFAELLVWVCLLDVAVCVCVLCFRCVGCARCLAWFHHLAGGFDFKLMVVCSCVAHSQLKVLVCVVEFLV